MLLYFFIKNNAINISLFLILRKIESGKISTLSLSKLNNLHAVQIFINYFCFLDKNALFISSIKASSSKGFITNPLAPASIASFIYAL